MWAPSLHFRGDSFTRPPQAIQVQLHYSVRAVSCLWVFPWISINPIYWCIRDIFSCQSEATDDHSFTHSTYDTQSLRYSLPFTYARLISQISSWASLGVSLLAIMFHLITSALFQGQSDQKFYISAPTQPISYRYHLKPLSSLASSFSYVLGQGPAENVVDVCSFSLLLSKSLRHTSTYALFKKVYLLFFYFNRAANFPSCLFSNGKSHVNLYF